ncbi:MAG: hypothetical protein IJU33_04775 [Bacteroidales bacterium]|nr:hypothetical protein [Bacteroidales bacterium]
MKIIQRIFTPREMYEAAQMAGVDEFDFFSRLLSEGYIDEQRRLQPEKEKEFREEYGAYFDWA